jgi:segregation and condensation protein A
MDTPTVQASLGETPINYHVKTEHFEGPLDLLLSLVEKRKLFISDFSLAHVADDYIAHIRRFETFPMNDVANFLLVASTLVLIKSKAILPNLNLTKEEEGDIDDLKRRLQMYELFRNLAVHVKSNFGRQLMFERSGRPEMQAVFAPDVRVSAGTMSEAIWSVVNALPKKIIAPKATIKKVVSLEEMMNRLSTRVTAALKTSFTQFSRYQKGAVTSRELRVEIIVSFLAMLELVKQGVVHVTQHEDYGDIDIETHKFETPQYG